MKSVDLVWLSKQLATSPTTERGTSHGAFDHKKKLKTNKNRQWDREDVASNLIQFEKVCSHTSQHQASKELGVPRTTLRHWLARKDSLDVSSVVAAFFEHPDGLAFLHRLVVATPFVMLLRLVRDEIIQGLGIEDAETPFLQ